MIPDSTSLHLAHVQSEVRCDPTTDSIHSADSIFPSASLRCASACSQCLLTDSHQATASQHFFLPQSFRSYLAFRRIAPDCESRLRVQRNSTTRRRVDLSTPNATCSRKASATPVCQTQPSRVHPHHKLP